VEQWPCTSMMRKQSVVWIKAMTAWRVPCWQHITAQHNTAHLSTADRRYVQAMAIKQHALPGTSDVYVHVQGRMPRTKHVQTSCRHIKHTKESSCPPKMLRLLQAYVDTSCTRQRQASYLAAAGESASCSSLKLPRAWSYEHPATQLEPQLCTYPAYSPADLLLLEASTPVYSAAHGACNIMGCPCTYILHICPHWFQP
jgi:hypothetical protein